MKKVKGLATLAAIAVGVSALFTVSSPAGADTGDVIYQSCSTEHAVTTDDNGIKVICEQWPYGQSNQWMPVLVPDTLAQVTNESPCSVVGLVAQRAGWGSYLVCSRHFGGYYWWNHNIS